MLLIVIVAHAHALGPHLHLNRLVDALLLPPQALPLLQCSIASLTDIEGHVGAGIENIPDAFARWSAMASHKVHILQPHSITYQSST